jgi:hypothetical protein
VHSGWFGLQTMFGYFMFYLIISFIFLCPYMFTLSLGRNRGVTTLAAVPVNGVLKERQHYQGSVVEQASCLPYQPHLFSVDLHWVATEK